jgi:hypothetical protein
MHGGGIISNPVDVSVAVNNMDTTWAALPQTQTTGLNQGAVPSTPQLPLWAAQLIAAQNTISADQLQQLLIMQQAGRSFQNGTNLMRRSQSVERMSNKVESVPLIVSTTKQPPADVLPSTEGGDDQSAASDGNSRTHRAFSSCNFNDSFKSTGSDEILKMLAVEDQDTNGNSNSNANGSVISITPPVIDDDVGDYDAPVNNNGRGRERRRSLSLKRTQSKRTSATSFLGSSFKSAESDFSVHSSLFNESIASLLDDSNRERVDVHKPLPQHQNSSGGNQEVPDLVSSPNLDQLNSQRTNFPHQPSDPSTNSSWKDTNLLLNMLYDWNNTLQDEIVIPQPLTTPSPHGCSDTMKAPSAVAKTSAEAVVDRSGFAAATDDSDLFNEILQDFREKRHYENHAGPVSDPLDHICFNVDPTPLSAEVEGRHTIIGANSACNSGSTFDALLGDDENCIGTIEDAEGTNASSPALPNISGVHNTVPKSMLNSTSQSPDVLPEAEKANRSEQESGGANVVIGMGFFSQLQDEGLYDQVKGTTGVKKRKKNMRHRKPKPDHLKNVSMGFFSGLSGDTTVVPNEVKPKRRLVELGAIDVANALAPLYTWAPTLDESQRFAMEYSLPIVVPGVAMLAQYSSWAYKYCIILPVVHTLETMFTSFGPDCQHLHLRFAPITPFMHLCLDLLLLHPICMAMVIWPHLYGLYAYHQAAFLFFLEYIYWAVAYKDIVVKRKEKVQVRGKIIGMGG